MEVFTAAEVISQELAQAAAVVGTLELLAPINHVKIEASRFEDATPTISVHDCTPEQLAQAVALWGAAGEHKDADEITRWVEVEVAGFTVTFFRR
jgi:hypothetical protein